MRFRNGGHYAATTGWSPYRAEFCGHIVPPSEVWSPLQHHSLARHLTYLEIAEPWGAHMQQLVRSEALSQKVPLLRYRGLSSKIARQRCAHVTSSPQESLVCQCRLCGDDSHQTADWGPAMCSAASHTCTRNSRGLSLRFFFSLESTGTVPALMKVSGSRCGTSTPLPTSMRVSRGVRSGAAVTGGDPSTGSRAGGVARICFSISCTI